MFTTLGIFYATAGAGAVMAASGTHLLRSGNSLLRGRFKTAGAELGAAVAAPLVLNWRAWGGFVEEGLELIGQTGKTLREVGDRIMPSSGTAGLRGAAAAAAFAAAGGATVATASPTVRKIIAVEPTVSSAPPSVPPSVDEMQEAMAKLMAASPNDPAEEAARIAIKTGADLLEQNRINPIPPLGGYFSVKPDVDPSLPANAVAPVGDYEDPDAIPRGPICHPDDPRRQD